MLVLVFNRFIPLFIGSSTLNCTCSDFCSLEFPCECAPGYQPDGNRGSCIGKVLVYVLHSLYTLFYYVLSSVMIFKWRMSAFSETALLYIYVLLCGCLIEPWYIYIYRTSKSVCFGFSTKKLEQTFNYNNTNEHYS